MIEPIPRGNYYSGDVFVLEYDGMRFTFSEDDFRERTEHAALMLRFIHTKLGEDEQEDLVDLTVNGKIAQPQSPLGDHIAKQNESVLQGRPDSPGLVHWLKRIVFRGAWLDQRAMEYELDIKFIPETGDFKYINGNGNLIETAPTPSWEAVAYQGIAGP